MVAFNCGGCILIELVLQFLSFPLAFHEISLFRKLIVTLFQIHCTIL